MTGEMKQEFQARHGWIGHFYYCTACNVVSGRCNVPCILVQQKKKKKQHRSPLRADWNPR